MKNYLKIPKEEKKLIDLKKRALIEMRQVVKELVDSDVDSFEIIGSVTEKYPVSEQAVKAEINKYVEKRKRDLPSYDINTIISLHARRYESIYTKCLGMEELWDDPDTNKSTIIAYFANALTALKKKEEILGLHKKTIKTKIAQSVVKVTKREIRSHSFDNLSLEEKLELRELLRKSRIKPIEGFHTVELSQTEITQTITYHDRKQTEELGLVDVIGHIAEHKEEKVIFEPIKIEGEFKSRESVLSLIKARILQDQAKVTLEEINKKIEREKNGI